MEVDIVLRRLALLGAGIAFLRSPRGKQFVAQTRQRLDTPENRSKLREAAAGLRSGEASGGSAGSNA